MEFLLYIFKVNIGICVFYSFYRLALHSLSFHQWNRFYLVGMVILSGFIPWVEIPLSGMDNRFGLDFQPRFFQNFQVNLPDSQVAEKAVTDSFSMINGLLFLYFSVALCLLTKFFLDIWQVVKIIKKSKKKKTSEYVLVETDELPISSFFGYLFLQNADLSEKELRQIIRHEQVHIREMHSFDLMFFQFLRAFSWFNPIMGLAKKSISELHEYIADADVVRTSSPADYARLLLKLSVGTVQYNALNKFSTIKIKLRIMKLNQMQSDKSQKIRFALAMPLLAMLVMLFSYGSPLFAQESMLIGTWKGADMKMKFNEGATVTQDAYDDMALLIPKTTYLFNADGTFKYTSTHRETYEETGTWKISADKKFIEFEGQGKKVQHEIIELSSKKLITKEIQKNSGGVFTWGEFTATYVKE